MSFRKSEFKWNLIGLLGKTIIDLIFRTAAIEAAGLGEVKEILRSRRVIFAVWHSRILLVSYLFKGWNGVALVSRSEDGEIIARVLQRQGQEIVRGSTTRGGLAALIAILKKISGKNRSAVIIPDGPQGPRFKVQPGIISLARKSGHPIVPVTYSARRMKVFASWDRFVLPFPFTRCRVVFGRPLWVSQNADRQKEEENRLELEQELCRITSMADRSFGHEIS
jgi:lysophospholipid acyltransferase (LPLAT)-like uncharacterized protein